MGIYPYRWWMGYFDTLHGWLLRMKTVVIKDSLVRPTVLTLSPWRTVTVLQCPLTLLVSKKENKKSQDHLRQRKRPWDFFSVGCNSWCNFSFVFPLASGNLLLKGSKSPVCWWGSRVINLRSTSSSESNPWVVRELEQRFSR